VVVGMVGVVDVVVGASVVLGVESVDVEVVVESVDGVGASVTGDGPDATATAGTVVVEDWPDFLECPVVVEVVLLLELEVDVVEVVLDVDGAVDVVLAGGMDTVAGGSWTAAACGVGESPGEKTRKATTARAAQATPAVQRLVGQASSDHVRAGAAAGGSKTNSSWMGRSPHSLSTRGSWPPRFVRMPSSSTGATSLVSLYMPIFCL
jgi:hypothetical protein